LAGRTPKYFVAIRRRLCSAYAQLLNNYLYSSNENARLSNKKTISPQDVMSALKDAELEEFLPRLEAELKSEPLT
jgi:hypothetical protein